MCGICGIIDPIYKNRIKELSYVIAHRGPDDSGVFEDNYIALGHLRLAIQDLSPNGHQPMFSYDKKYCIIFNGEIYNHWEIRENLKNKYPFKSTSDTETILYGFIEYGTELFNKLNGIFAFAIYNLETQELTIVRDQFGIKPLYYYKKDKAFLFSSEIKAFLRYPNFDNTLNFNSLANYLTFLWSAGEVTPFKYVQKLLPGHFISINVNQIDTLKIEKYYEIPFDNTRSPKNEAELIRELDELLFKAVKRQLLSDVPVGFFLSGGLDSSAIVAMAKRANPNIKLRCYTIDSGNQMSNEGFSDDLYYARKVATHLDVDLQIVRGEIDILKDFDKMIYHLDEPQADIAPIHVLNICKQARKDGYIVLLGGTAGDDIFSGYRRHQALYYEKYFKLIPRYLARKINQYTNFINITNPRVRRFKKILNELDKEPIDRLVGYFAWLSPETVKSLFTPSVRNLLGDYNPLDILKDALINIPNEENELNKMLYLEMKYFLCDHNLNYTDKLSMATGVEVRVPFLDKELVEFSTRIPVELKMKGKTVKYLLKKVMEKYLPRDVIYRPKAGFGAPVRQWINNELDKTIREKFTKEKVEQRGIFDYDKLQELITLNKSNKIDASYTILSLLAIESWMIQFNIQKHELEVI